MFTLSLSSPATSLPPTPPAPLAPSNSQLEDKKHEREVARALAAQEKVMTRQRNREAGGGGPPDDLEVEMDQLVAAAKAAGVSFFGGGD